MKHYIYVLMVLGIGSFIACTNSPTKKEATDAVVLKTVSNKQIKERDLDQFIRKAMDSVTMPGLSIAIINDAKVVYHKSFGVTNSTSKEQVTPQTIFEAASLSKPLFAYFAMKMVEKGVLDLDKPMKEYLPHPAIAKESTKFYELVTPRMVLAHSAGFPNWSHGKAINIPFKPGTGFSYSGEAYQYLAAVIGQLNGVGWGSDLDEVFQKEVAQSLNLMHSSYTWNTYFSDHKATGHKEGQITDNDKQGKNFGAGYSLHTEASDYSKFLIEMMNGNHLKKELWEDMLKEQIKFPNGHELLETGQTGWGLGFAMKPTPNGMRYLHTGNNHDFQSYCCFYKDQKYGLVLFTNSDKMEPFYDLLGSYLEDDF